MDANIRKQISFQAKIELIKRYAKNNDILAWGKLLFPHKFDREYCYELHQYLVDISEECITSTLAPRNHAKTTIRCFLIPLFYALNYPRKYKHILNIQNTSTKAININLSIRMEIETNDMLRKIYGEQVSSTKWTEKQFVLENGVIFSSIGAGDSVRGINYNQIRPDMIIADDIYDEADIGNKPSIEKKENWFWGSIYPARAQTKRTSIHVQGTAIDKIDLIHKLMKFPKCKSRIFRAIIDSNKKLTLWFSYEQLMEDKLMMGSHIFNREMQNECRDDETAIIKSEWIIQKPLKMTYSDGKYYINGNVIVKKIGAVDPAVGVKSNNDFTGKAIVFMTEDKMFYVFDAYNHKLSSKKNVEHLQALHSKYLLDILKLEAISAFQIMGQQILETTNVPLQMITSVKDKISRLEGQSYKFENGRVIINSNISEAIKDELIYQLTTNEPAHEDMRDAVILALEEEFNLKGVQEEHIGIGASYEIFDM
jgi:predicted phage terminase large subunit-like protein